VGAQGDNTATPAAAQVAITGTGFSSSFAANLSGDSLYKITIGETGAQPAVTGVTQVATGIRNVFGMTFDSAGDLYFADNGIDELPPGSSQPMPPPGEPPQADELDFISASQLASGTPLNFGFPNCYIQYAWGSIPGVPVGTGCVQPLVAFQPVTDAAGIHQLKGVTQVALAPSTFPAGFNNGIFVGFTGDGGLNNNGGMAYYDFGTGVYTQFIESTNVGSIIGLNSTSNALYFTDVFSGTIYELTAAPTPEPATAATAALTLLVVAVLRRRF
jgi:glucose/arabinose dehydrogenase